MRATHWLLVGLALCLSACINVGGNGFPGRNDCNYAGATYSAGSRMCQGGMTMACESGNWRSTSQTCS